MAKLIEGLTTPICCLCIPLQKLTTRRAKRFSNQPVTSSALKCVFPSYSKQFLRKPVLHSGGDANSYAKQFCFTEKLSG